MAGRLTLDGYRIVLGLTGSVAVYRSVDLARELIRRGAQVTVAMTRDAARMVGPMLLEWATGSKVYTEFGGVDNHIGLTDRSDALIVAPATANTLSKMAWGVADTTVTLLAQSFLGTGKPVLVVPAMHVHLYQSPAVREALDRLRGIGVEVVEPLVEEGKAKYPPIDELVWRIEAFLLRGKDLSGLRVLVTAGPTREHIDPVRFISNPSTGRMGVAVALEAAYRGAETHLVHGPLSVPLHRGLASRHQVVSTREMVEKTVEVARKVKPHIVVLAGAPADYEPLERSGKKIPTSLGELRLTLRPTPKVAEALAEAVDGAVVVGFAAETASNEEELVSRALEKAKRYGFHLVVANYVGRPDTGFASEVNEVVVLRSEKIAVKGRFLKRVLARLLLDEVKSILEEFGYGQTRS